MVQNRIWRTLGFVQAGVDACAANIAPHEVAPQHRICDLQEGFLVGNIEESELVEGGQVSAAWMDYLSLKGYERTTKVGLRLQSLNFHYKVRVRVKGHPKSA